jgi:hypothetical protein
MRRSGHSRRRFRLVRLGAAIFGVLAALLVWVALAGGVQQYETYEAAVLASGPVAQFRFDDAAGSTKVADSVGSYTASNSGVTLGGEGPFGGSKSGSFGGSALATLPSDPLKEASAFTAEAWVDWAGGSSYGQPLFDFASGATNYMYLTPSSTASKHPMLFEIHTGTGSASVSATKLGAKSWEYVVVTETSSGTLSLYLNGEPVAEVTKATVTPASLGSSVPDDYLGGGPLSSSEPRFSGSLSNVAFYAKALTASEVKEHYDDAEFPVNISPPTISGTAKDGKTLTAKEGSWIGLPPESWKFQWELCDAAGMGCASISEAIRSTLLLGHGDVERTLRVAVTAKNKSGKEGTATSAATAVVAAIKLSNLTLPAISGTAEVGQELTVSDGTWEGSPPTRYGYEWETCNSSGAKCKGNGGTSQVYEPGAAEASAKDTLRAVVTAENSAGPVSATSAATAVIAPGPPRDKTPPATSGTATEGGRLTASEGVWVGTEPITLKHEWQRCSGGDCSTVATGLSYEPTSSDVGSSLKFVVTAENSVSEVTASATTAVVTGRPLDTEPPTISGSASEGMKLAASEGTWTGTAPIRYEYQWQLCNRVGEECEAIEGAVGATYTLDQSDVEKRVRVVVTATNELGSSAATSPSSAVVLAAAPANTSLPIIAGTPEQGQTLTAGTGSWEGAPTGYTYQWQRCNDGGAGCVDIAGATSASYELGESDVDETIRIRVTATNIAGSVSVSSVASSVVSGDGALAPASTAAPSISGDPQDGQTLDASPGAWSGTQPLSYSYQWQSCNRVGEECQAIEGATGEEYVPSELDVGSVLRVLVSASGPGGATQATSAASPMVQAGSPSELEPPSISGSVTVGATLSAEPGEWGGSEVQIAYQWQRCDEAGSECQDIPGATESEYVPGETDAGMTLRVLVGASNDLGSVAQVSPPTGTVEATTLLLNTWAPSISGEAQVGGTLIADPGGWLGSEAISYTYQWQSCDIDGSDCENIESATSPEYTTEQALAGRTLRVLVGAREMEGSGEEISPTTQPIAGEGAPVPEIAPGSSGTGLVGHTLSATGGMWAGEGPISYSYQWERCGEDGNGCTTITGANTSSYTLTDADERSTVRALVSATNPHGTSEAVSAPIGTSAVEPVNVSPPRVSGALQLGHPLSASPGIWTGSGSIAFSYEWDRCTAEGEGCESISGAQQQSYTPGEADAGSALDVVVTASSTAGSARAASPPTPAIGSEATGPEDISSPSIVGTLTAGDRLSAEPGVWAGAEPISYAYRWQRCDATNATCVEIEGATGATFTLTEADVGSRLRVVLSATNAVGTASTTSPASQLVGAAGPPATTASPAITGRASEGQLLFAENGKWSGSLPLTYYYQWERCNTAGEACADIEGATKLSYIPTSADVGASLRVEVTATNSLGALGALSPQTAVVSPAGQVSSSPAVESIESTDPSMLSRSTTAKVEEESLTPAIVDPGEELASQSTLASSTISKIVPGEFAVNTPDGELSFAPAATIPNADAMPTVVNGSASLFVETWHDADTVIRPTALGASILLQLRSAEAPTSFSWQVNLGEKEQLEALPDGAVAVSEVSSSNIEGPLGEEGPKEPQPTKAPAQTTGEGLSETAGEQERHSLVEETGLTPLPPAPTLSVSEATVKEDELRPQDTEAVYERDKQAMELAETHDASTPLMVIQAPTVLDALGRSVPAALTVNGDTLTLTLSPKTATYPLSAEVATSAPTDLVSTARDGPTYGLSDVKRQDFEPLNAKLKGAPLQIGVARDIVPYFAWQETEKREELLKWLKAVSAAGLTPYITLEAGYGGLDRCDEPTNCPTFSVKKYEEDTEELMKALVNGIPSEQISAVTKWGAMNEPDEIGSNPLFAHSEEAAELWKVANFIATEKLKCGKCQVAAGEFASYSPYVAKYIGSLRRDTKDGTALPRVWGLHDYGDLLYARQHKEAHEGNPEIRKFIKALNGLPKAHIWLSEQGVELREASDVLTGLAKGETIHGRKFSRDELQREAADEFLELSKGYSSRIELVDYYQYLGPTLAQTKEPEEGFDSALRAGSDVAANEKQTERPAYCVLVLHQHGGCTPGVKAARASGVGATTAAVTALVDPEGLPTTYAFAYGATTAYGEATTASTLPSPTGEQSATTAISGLKPCTTYHYQAIVENEASEGTPTVGGDGSFQTGCKPTISIEELPQSHPIERVLVDPNELATTVSLRLTASITPDHLDGGAHGLHEYLAPGDEPREVAEVPSEICDFHSEDFESLPAPNAFEVTATNEAGATSQAVPATIFFCFDE